MSSSVFFKFKSEKEPSRVVFDGTGISVFELKREIIKINNLGDGHNFDLHIYNSDTNEEYDDDTTIIPRSTSISAKRLPAARPGRGTAARYVSGKAPVTAKNSGRTEKSSARDTKISSKPEKSSSGVSIQNNGNLTEEERIAAMLNADAAQWDLQKQDMANATPVYRSGPMKGKPPPNVPNNPPPAGYICYRCGEKGHYIQQCPTNDDPNYDGRPRVKRTTGIPRSFLRTVAKPESMAKDGLGDDNDHPSGVMVNAEGEYVVAEPDSASWAQFQAKAKASEQAQQLAAEGSKELRDLGLECPIDKKLFVEPTKTPCCTKTYCNECITNALLEGDLTCPGCQTEGILLDDLATDEELAIKVKEYKEKRAHKSQESRGSKSPEKSMLEAKQASSSGTDEKNQKANDVKASVETSTKIASPKYQARTDKLDLPTAVPDRASSSTPGANSTTSNGSKKRAADGDLENVRVPKAPAAMRQQQQQQQQQQQYQIPPQTNGNLPMNNMPMGNIPNNNMMFNPQQSMGNFQNGMGFGYMPPQAGGYMGMPMGMDPNTGMMPMGGFPMGGYDGSSGFNSQYGYNGFMPNGAGNQMGMMGMGMQGGMMPGNNNGQYQQQNRNNNRGGYAGNNGGGRFPNQQLSNNGNGGGGAVGTNNAASRGAGGDGGTGAEDSAYFRQPVNPHRHQTRQRRMRPSDYREL